MPKLPDFQANLNCMRYVKAPVFRYAEAIRQKEPLHEAAAPIIFNYASSMAFPISLLQYLLSKSTSLTAS